jgi:hypothetical protein
MEVYYQSHWNAPYVLEFLGKHKKYIISIINAYQIMEQTFHLTQVTPCILHLKSDV